MDKVILIISNDSSRTGAPILLLNTLKGIKSNSDFNFVLILREGGDLLEEYRAICDVYILPKFLSFVKHVPERILKKEFKLVLLYLRGLILTLFVQKLKRRYNVSLTFSNTATNGELLPIIRKIFGGKIISWIHEGENLLDLHNFNGEVNTSVSMSDVILTVSEIVKRTLVSKYEASQEIVVIPGGVDTGVIYDNDNRNLLRQEGISDDKIVLMSCGWLDQIKGIDLLIQLAIFLCKRSDKIHFIWVGGKSSDKSFINLKSEIDKSNLTERITLITAKSNVQSYMRCSDIFLMLSREESFSLVTLEAGLAGKAVLCFDKVGGPLEILNFDQRFVVPYLDVFEMGERILKVLNDDSLRSQMSEYIQNRVLVNYSIEKCASSILSEINLCLADNSLNGNLRERSI